MPGPRRFWHWSSEHCLMVNEHCFMLLHVSWSSANILRLQCRGPGSGRVSATSRHVIRVGLATLCNSILSIPSAIRSLSGGRSEDLLDYNCWWLLITMQQTITSIPFSHRSGNIGSHCLRISNWFGNSMIIQISNANFEIQTLNFEFKTLFTQNESLIAESSNSNPILC